jgi:aspartate kinase
VALLVQKFGGTSVGSVERIKNVARRCLAAQRAGNQVVLIVSAMSGETNRLLSLAHEVTRLPDAREMDVIAATGEQVSAALMALAIQSEGGQARSLLGHQVKILTDGAFTKARIRTIEGSKIFSTVESGQIAVVAGFQGVDEHGDITTLGRGGSDTSAVAVAAAIGAGACEIYTDVEGVFTTDPNVVSSAKKIARVSYEEMLELASLGAKVLQIRSVEIAMNYNVPIHVRSSFSEAEGTWVTKEDNVLEDIVVSGIAFDKNEARVLLVGLEDRPGVVAKIFGTIAEKNVSVDMIIQSVSTVPSQGTARTDVTFTVTKADLERAKPAIEEVAREVGAREVRYDEDVVKVSIVGLGMRSHAGVAAKMFRVLAEESINIQAISTSEIKVSCLVAAKYTELAVRALHDAFELGKDRATKGATAAPKP